MNPDRAQKIESYGRAYEALAEALKEFPAEMWQFKPAPEKWSVHETVVHIADSEANSYARCRRLIAEPGKDVMAYDENHWAAALDYHGQSTDEALELFRALRRNTYHLIRSLPEPVWSHTIYHPENGTMTMDDWLDVYERHIPEHIAQMQAVHREWAAQRAQ
jgi:uncharacterized damage-inducible protein DinB